MTLETKSGAVLEIEDKKVVAEIGSTRLFYKIESLPGGHFYISCKEIQKRSEQNSELWKKPTQVNVMDETALTIRKEIESLLSEKEESQIEKVIIGTPPGENQKTKGLFKTRYQGKGRICEICTTPIRRTSDCVNCK